MTFLALSEAGGEYSAESFEADPTAKRLRNRVVPMRVKEISYAFSEAGVPSELRKDCGRWEYDACRRPGLESCAGRE